MEGFDCDGNIIQIGEEYKGGIIFYIDDSGIHGLISAISDAGSYVQWGCYGGFRGVDNHGIGFGYVNTELLLEANCLTMNDGGDSAAKIASEFR